VPLDYKWKKGCLLLLLKGKAVCRGEDLAAAIKKGKEPSKSKVGADDTKKGKRIDHLLEFTVGGGKKGTFLMGCVSWERLVGGCPSTKG